MNLMNLMKLGHTSGQTLAKIAAHGGNLNVLQGGKFRHGFLSAGFTEALSPAVGQLGDGVTLARCLQKHPSRRAA